MPMRPVTPFMMMPRVFAILSLHLQGHPGRPQADPGCTAPRSGLASWVPALRCAPAGTTELVEGLLVQMPAGVEVRADRLRQSAMKAGSPIISRLRGRPSGTS